MKGPAAPRRRRRLGRRHASGYLTAAGASLLCGMLAAAAAGQGGLDEYQLKAAHLLNLGKFVAWPEGPADSDSFAVCVLGEHPVGPVLEAAAAGAVIQDRPVAIRRLGEVEEAHACRVLFVPASQEGRFPAVPRALGAAPILTVGDLPGFAGRGGMIELLFDATRVRFSVNLDAAERAGLVLSSELLRLAMAVERATPP